MKKIIAIIILIVLGYIWLSTEKIDESAMFIPFEPLEATTTPNIAKLSPPRLHRITCYTATGNKTASGKTPRGGMVATSDRTIPFGTKIEIEGIEYVVEDRTNKRFQYFETPTIDIFWEGSRESCLEFGVKYKNVKAERLALKHILKNL